MLRVLHISSATSWRGGERQLTFLAEGCNKHDISSFLMAPSKSELVKKSNQFFVETIDFKKGILNIPINIKRLKSAIAQYNIDLIHGHDSHAHTLLYLAYKYGGLHTKSIVTRRLNNSIKEKSKNKYNHPKIEKIICISNAVKETISASINDHKRVVTVPSGIDTQSRYPKNNNGLLNTKHIIYVAAFTKEKRHDVFFDVADALNKMTNEKYKYILIGSGPLLDNYRKQYEGKDIYVFTGFENDVENHYVDADILLHTSENEALGTSILDAMKYGIPTVASKIGGITEIVKHGVNGFLHPIDQPKKMASSIVEILSNQTTYSSMSISAKHTAEQYSKEKMVEGNIDVYKQVISGV